MNSNSGRVEKLQNPTLWAQLLETLEELTVAHQSVIAIAETENAALVSLALEVVQNTQLEKQSAIEKIKQMERHRMECMQLIRSSELASSPQDGALLEGTAIRSWIEYVSKRDVVLSERLLKRSATLLSEVEKAYSANQRNEALVKKALLHIEAMKRNVLGEAVPKSETYTGKAQRKPQTQGARLLSQEV